MSKTYYQFHNSPADFFAKAKSLKAEELQAFPVALDVFDSCERDKEGDFHGSWAETCRRFDECDFRSARASSLIDSVIDRIRTSPFSELRWKFSRRLEEGDGVDVDAYLAGSERCWNGVKRTPRKKRAVRIYVNAGGNSHRSKQELAVAGAVGVTMAEMLEASGVAAEIWAVHYTAGINRDGDNLVDMLRLKRQSEYADIGLIAFMLGDDGVYRNGQFRVEIACSVRNGKDVMPDLGRSMTASLSAMGFTETEAEDAVIIPQFFGAEEAEAWLAAEMAGYAS